MIEARNLSKAFGPIQAVKDLSFEIREGEVVGLLGPNGAGKSTTIKMLTGYLTPTSGSVKVADLDASRDMQTIRRRIGYMPQDIPLYEEMVVLDYLHFVADIRHIPRAGRREKIREAAERCSIEKVITQSIGTLSSGYKQRVGLAQALIHNPDILILDEPTSDLDPNQIVEIRNLIKDIGKEKTVIISSHILSEVQATCGRVMIISEGNLVADGSPDELLAKERSENIVHITFLEVGTEEGAQALKLIDGVMRVNALEEGRFVVEARKGKDIRPFLFHLAVARNWVILEMRTEQISLEDVFRKLTLN
jgi:ABC-2 type transport system ATP-binding protein